MPRQPVFDLTCMLCGRQAGQIVAGRYRPSPSVPAPVSTDDGLRCATCGGRIYLDEDPLTEAKEIIQAV